MTRLLLAFAIPLLLSQPAHATPTSELEASLRHEANAIGLIIKTIDATLVASERGTVDDTMVKAHRSATVLYQEADELCRARSYESCYRKLRDAKHAVMPAAELLWSRGVPREVHRTIAANLEAAAQRVAATAALLADRTTPEATAAYKKAATLYREGKALYAKGRYRQAFANLEPALDALDIAIRAVWRAKS